MFAEKEFFFQRYLPASLRMNLFNAYYPVIISGFSIIICFWAEVSDIPIAQVPAMVA